MQEETASYTKSDKRQNDRKQIRHNKVAAWI